MVTDTTMKSKTDSRTTSQKIAQRGAFGKTTGKIDNAVVRDEAVAGLSADEEGREFHAEIFS